VRFANTRPEPALQDGPWMTIFADTVQP